ncbi:UNVERIFIED_CONTAM: hypothetical protein Slati_4237700 [Sesamum latifolium]|uniref:Retrotransposon gag domain-containing protein n=1 Tax=Sesamum latifolium TaxID=2727402 RepID=A0AAW2TD78_9LAMI
MADELSLNWKEPNLSDYDGTMDPQELLSCFENIALLHRYTAGVKCRVFVNTFTRSAQQWFNQLPSGSIRSFREFRSLFLHHFASSKRYQKTIMSLFSLQQREGESLKEYLQRFNLAALEVPTATSNALICAFTQKLQDEDFFKSLTKKPHRIFYNLLALAEQYINLEEAREYKNAVFGEKYKEQKDEDAFFE